VRWLYARLNLFSSSPGGQAYLASLREPKQRAVDDRAERRSVEVTHIAAVRDLLGGTADAGRWAAVWPAGDRLWSVHGDSIEVAMYEKARGKEQFVERLEPVRVSEARVPGGEPPPRLGRRFIFDEDDNNQSKAPEGTPGVIQREPLRNLSIVGADSAPFGFVLEAESGLLVVESSLESFWLAGEPVNWRVFPRSRYYTNQLHVITEKALNIYSFCGDYFVDQATKRAGMPVARDMLAGSRGRGRPYEGPSEED
jgi:hypothetical protein